MRLRAAEGVVQPHEIAQVASAWPRPEPLLRGLVESGSLLRSPAIWYMSLSWELELSSSPRLMEEGVCYEGFSGSEAGLALGDGGCSGLNSYQDSGAIARIEL